MQLILLTGIPGSGKSTFYKQRFADTHMRINLDMLRTRCRESILFRACLEAKADIVVDNTNLTRAARMEYLKKAQIAHYSIQGYYFESSVTSALARNAMRTEEARAPDKAILSAAKLLEVPVLEEGYGQLSIVRLRNSEFEVRDCCYEV